MDLWRKNFQDSEEFVRFYFDRKYSDTDSLVYEENGKALSALLMLPYPMTWAGTLIPTSYISGACTQKDARNRGIMTLLLQESFPEMYKQDIALSTLIPAEEWLFQYYGRLGYAQVFDYSTESYTTFSHHKSTEWPTLSPEHFDMAFTQAQYPFFKSKMERYACCVQHPLEDYTAIVEEAYLSGGRLVICRSPETGSTTGWALAVPSGNTLYVKELLYHSKQEKEALLHSLFRIFAPDSITCRTLPVFAAPTRYGMARVIHAYSMLSHIAARRTGLSLSIKVNDPQLPANNGSYILDRGECIKTEATGQTADIETDIPSLTKALLGYYTEQLPQPLNSLNEKQYPYLNLMMD